MELPALWREILGYSRVRGRRSDEWVPVLGVLFRLRATSMFELGLEELQLLYWPRCRYCWCLLWLELELAEEGSLLLLTPVV